MQVNHSQGSNPAGGDNVTVICFAGSKAAFSLFAVKTRAFINGLIDEFINEFQVFLCLGKVVR